MFPYSPSFPRTQFEKEMSSSKVDPRREERIVPFHLPKKGEDEDDYNHIISTFVGEFFLKTNTYPT